MSEERTTRRSTRSLTRRTSTETPSPPPLTGPATPGKRTRSTRVTLLSSIAESNAQTSNGLKENQENNENDQDIPNAKAKQNVSSLPTVDSPKPKRGGRRSLLTQENVESMEPIRRSRRLSTGSEVSIDIPDDASRSSTPVKNVTRRSRRLSVDSEDNVMRSHAVSIPPIVEETQEEEVNILCSNDYENTLNKSGSKRQASIVDQFALGSTETSEDDVIIVEPDVPKVSNLKQNSPPADIITIKTSPMCVSQSDTPKMSSNSSKICESFSVISTNGADTPKPKLIQFEATGKTPSNGNVDSESNDSPVDQLKVQLINDESATDMTEIITAEMKDSHSEDINYTQQTTVLMTSIPVNSCDVEITVTDTFNKTEIISNPKENSGNDSSGSGVLLQLSADSTMPVDSSVIDNTDNESIKEKNGTSFMELGSASPITCDIHVNVSQKIVNVSPHSKSLEQCSINSEKVATHSQIQKDVHLENEQCILTIKEKDSVHSKKEADISFHSKKEMENSEKETDVSVHSKKEADVFIHSDKEANVLIRLDKEADVSVHSDKEADVSVRSDKEADVSVRSDKEADVSIRSDKEADVSIPSDKEADVSVRPVKKGDVLIRSEKEADVSIRSEKDADVSIRSEKDADVSIRSEKDADVSIRSEKDGVVTIRSEKEADVTIRSEKEADVSIRLEKEAVVSIRSEKVADVSIRSEKEADVSIRSEKEADVSIRSEKEADVSIRSEKEADVSIRSEKDADVSIRSEKEAYVSIRSEKEADVSICSEKEADVSIHSEKEEDVLIRAEKEADVSIRSENEADVSVRSEKQEADSFRSEKGADILIRSEKEIHLEIEVDVHSEAKVSDNTEHDLNISESCEKTETIHSPQKELNKSVNSKKSAKENEDTTVSSNDVDGFVKNTVINTTEPNTYNSIIKEQSVNILNKSEVEIMEVDTSYVVDQEKDISNSANSTTENKLETTSDTTDRSIISEKSISVKISDISEENKSMSKVDKSVSNIKDSHNIVVSEDITNNTLIVSDDSDTDTEVHKEKEYLKIDSDSSDDYIDDEAKDAGKDYESNDSMDEEERDAERENKFLEGGHSIESTDGEEVEDDDYERNSFCIDSRSEDEELLEGMSDDLESRSSSGLSDLSQSKAAKQKYNAKSLKKRKSIVLNVSTDEEDIPDEIKDFELEEESNAENEAENVVSKLNTTMDLDRSTKLLDAESDSSNSSDTINIKKQYEAVLEQLKNSHEEEKTQTEGNKTPADVSSRNLNKTQFPKIVQVKLQSAKSIKKVGTKLEAESSPVTKNKGIEKDIELKIVELEATNSNLTVSPAQVNNDTNKNKDSSFTKRNVSLVRMSNIDDDSKIEKANSDTIKDGADDKAINIDSSESEEDNSLDKTNSCPNAAVEINNQLNKRDSDEKLKIIKHDNLEANSSLICINESDSEEEPQNDSPISEPNKSPPKNGSAVDSGGSTEIQKTKIKNQIEKKKNINKVDLNNIDLLKIQETCDKIIQKEEEKKRIRRESDNQTNNKASKPSKLKRLPETVLEELDEQQNLKKPKVDKIPEEKHQPKSQKLENLKVTKIPEGKCQLKSQNLESLTNKRIPAEKGQIVTKLNQQKAQKRKLEQSPEIVPVVNKKQRQKMQKQKSIEKPTEIVSVKPIEKQIMPSQPKKLKRLPETTLNKLSDVSNEFKPSPSKKKSKPVLDNIPASTTKFHVSPIKKEKVKDRSVIQERKRTVPSTSESDSDFIIQRLKTKTIGTSVEGCTTVFQIEAKKRITAKDIITVPVTRETSNFKQNVHLNKEIRRLEKGKFYAFKNKQKAHASRK